MVRRSRENASKNRKIIASLSSDVTRIKVTDDKGKMRWRLLEEVLDNDVIIINPKNKLPFTMNASPGRKKKVKLSPMTPRIAKTIEEKEKSIQKNPLVQMAKKDPFSGDLISHIVGNLSEEIAALEFERKEAERNGDSGLQFSHKRITALRSLGDMWMKRSEQLSGNTIDLEGDPFKRLFIYLMGLFKESLQNSEIPPQMIEIIFGNLAQIMEDGTWKGEAKKKMKDG